MNFEKIIGCTFQENEFFDILQFEIEENFEKYLSVNMHIFFERVGQLSIKISKVQIYKSSTELHASNKKYIEKKEFFYFYYNHSHIDLGLCRLNRSNPIAVIKKSGTFKQDWGQLWYVDEFPDEELTPEEVRLAFVELSGGLINNHVKIGLKNKKAA